MRRLKRPAALLLAVYMLCMSVFAGTSTVITGFGTSTVTFTNYTLDITTLHATTQSAINSYTNVVAIKRKDGAGDIAVSNLPFVMTYTDSPTGSDYYTLKTIDNSSFRVYGGSIGNYNIQTSLNIFYYSTGTLEADKIFMKGTITGTDFTLVYEPTPDLPPVIGITEILEPTANPYQTTNDYVDMTTFFAIETLEDWDSALLEINYTNDNNIVPDAGMQQLYNQITSSDTTPMELTEGYSWRMETRQTMRILDIDAGSHTLGIQIVYNGEVIASSTKSVEIFNNFVDADGDGIDDRTGEQQDAGTWNPIVIAIKSALAPITNIFKGIGDFFGGIKTWFVNLWTIIINGITSVTTAITSMIAVFIDIMSFLPGNSGTILFSGFVVVIIIIIINIVRGR